MTDADGRGVFGEAHTDLLLLQRAADLVRIAATAARVASEPGWRAVDITLAM
jgi:hypothetical protein